LPLTLAAKVDELEFKVPDCVLLLYGCYSFSCFRRVFFVFRQRNEVEKKGRGVGIAQRLSRANVHVISPFGFPGFELHEHAPSAPDSERATPRPTTPSRAIYHHHLPTIVFSDLDFNLRLISFMCASRFLFATFCFNKHTLCCLPPNLFSDSIFV